MRSRVQTFHGFCRCPGSSGLASLRVDSQVQPGPYVSPAPGLEVLSPAGGDQATVAELRGQSWFSHKQPDLSQVPWASPELVEWKRLCVDCSQAQPYTTSVYTETFDSVSSHARVWAWPVQQRPGANGQPLLAAQSALESLRVGRSTVLPPPIGFLGHFLLLFPLIPFLLQSPLFPIPSCLLKDNKLFV